MGLMMNSKDHLLREWKARLRACEVVQQKASETYKKVFNAVGDSPRALEAEHYKAMFELVYALEMCKALREDE